MLVTNTPAIFFDPVSTGMELIGWKLDDNLFSKVFFMCKYFFAYSFSKMDLKLTSKIPSQAIFFEIYHFFMDFCFLVVGR